MLVVEDSLTIRKRIVAVLSAVEDYEVVGEAWDGKAAIELCERLRPDVVTMDMMLPVMSGLGATEYIMAYCPTPILIVSASTNRGELFRTYDALAAGAVDVLEKPLGSEPGDAWEHQLVSAVRMVSRIRVITHPRRKLDRLERPHAISPPDVGERRVVAIGASTGGPGAVLSVLKALPPDFPTPVLLVVHISEPFGQAFAEWLNVQTNRPVRYPRDREPLPEPGDGVVLMARPDRHLELEGRRLRLTTGAPRHSCRPSVDVLFESLAREMGRETVACLLTGMGKDGALGMLAVRERGGLTIAQDEDSSVVYGMPGEAVRLNAASRVLPLPEIGRVLAEAVRVRQE